MNETKLIATIISRVPREYQVVIQSVQHMKQEAGKDMDIDTMETAMHDHWRISYGTRKGKNKDDGEEYIKEISLAVTDQDKKCFKCQQKGHCEELSQEGRRVWLLP